MKRYEYRYLHRLVASVVSTCACGAVPKRVARELARMLRIQRRVLVAPVAEHQSPLLLFDILPIWENTRQTLHYIVTRRVFAPAFAQRARVLRDPGGYINRLRLKLKKKGSLVTCEY